MHADDHTCRRTRVRHWRIASRLIKNVINAYTVIPVMIAPDRRHGADASAKIWVLTSQTQTYITPPPIAVGATARTSAPELSSRRPRLRRQLIASPTIDAMISAMHTPVRPFKVPIRIAGGISAVDV